MPGKKKQKAADEVKPKRGRGRPPIHDERWSKVMMILFDRQIVFLDRLCTDIRENTGASVNRTEIIRALIDTLAESKIDLKEVTSEADMKEVLLARLVG